jgi:hypothetical protein
MCTRRKTRGRRKKEECGKSEKVERRSINVMRKKPEENHYGEKKM